MNFVHTVQFNECLIFDSNILIETVEKRSKYLTYIILMFCSLSLALYQSYSQLMNYWCKQYGNYFINIMHFRRVRLL